MRTGVSTSLMLLLGAHFLCYAAAPADNAAVKGEVLEYGLMGLIGRQQRIDGSTTLDVEKQYADGARFTEQTDRIPAIPGVKFGFRYKITGIPDQRAAQFKMVVTHPPIKDEKGKVQRGYSTVEELPANNGYVSEVSGYGLDRPEELVPGVWTFEIWYRDQKIVSQSFTVYLPEKASDTKGNAK